MGDAVQVVREFIERWNQRDLGGMLALCSEDFVFVDRAAFPDASEHRGHEAARRHLEDILAAVDVDFDLREVREPVPGRVFAWVRMSGRGTGSGAGVEGEFFGVMHVEAGRILRRESYSTRDEALAAIRAAGPADAGPPSG